jgi:hypothetical protein
MAAAVKSPSEAPRVRLDLGLFRSAVNGAVLDFIDAGLRFAEPYTVMVKPNFSTACWAYLPPHRVWLGDRMLERSRPGLQRADLERYARAYCAHEFSHKLWTTRALKSMAESLKAKGIPFGLLNLFEDARIEARYRRDVGLRFEWLRYEPENEPVSPSGLLFALIQHEGEFDAPIGPLPEPCDSSRAIWKEYGAVVGYYREIVLCASTEALVPLLVRWVEQFPDDARTASGDAEGAGGRGRPRSGASGAAGNGDGMVGLNGSAEQELDADAMVIAGTGSAPRKKDAGQELQLVSEGTGELLLKDPSSNGYESGARARNVSECLARMLVRPTGWVGRQEPSRLIDIRSASSAPLTGWRFKHRELPRRCRFRVGLVFDCSSSMKGQPLQEGLVLVDALSNLASRGALEGCLILSAVTGRRAIWQRLALPLPAAAIARIHAFGGAEGLQPAMMSNARILGEMAQVLVYTDANICDKPLERKALASKRMHPIGLYVGDKSQEESLRSHFDEFLVRATVEALAEAIVARFLARGR